MIIFRLAVAILGVVMIIIGVITTPTPVPFGLIFIVLGFLLLTVAAPALVRRIRRRWRWLDRRLVALEKKAPRWLARRLRETGPPEDEEEEDAGGDEADSSDRADRQETPKRRARPNPLRQG